MSTGLTNDKSKDKIQSFHSSTLFSSPMTSLQVESQNTLKETKDARIKHLIVQFFSAMPTLLLTF